MLRCVLLALAGVAAAAVLAPGRAADGDLSGNWQLSNVGLTGDSAVCILKVETKDGKPTATVVFSPPNVKTEVTEFRTTGSTVAVSVKQTRTLKDKAGKEHEFINETAFVGARGTDPKVVLGSTGDTRYRSRAKLTATDKETLGKGELGTAAKLPEPMAEALKLGSQLQQAQMKAFREKDAEKKKELQKALTAQAKETDEKQTVLYRETAAKHPDDPAAFDAAANLLRSAGRVKLTTAEADTLVRLAQRHAAPYGPMFVGTTFTRIAYALSTEPDLASAAVVAIEPAVKALTDDMPEEYRFDVLDTYKEALTATAAALNPRLTKLDAALDAEWQKPVFEPTKYAGRKAAGANRVAVMELFTGAQCPPCVAADLAFDGLLKAYKPTDVVLLQYHVHVPGPDPLTNPDTLARYEYYDEIYPDNFGGTPSTLFNGKLQAGGGGGKPQAAEKFKEYARIIDKTLETSTEVKVSGRAIHSGGKVDVAVDVASADASDLRLRLLVVEDVVKYVGSNRVRFHHHVVRDMPGGAEGVAIKDKVFKHTATVDVGAVRKELTEYLDGYAKTRPFPKSDRPLDLKGLKVIALVQNDKTAEILQAAQIEIEENAAGN